MSTLRMNEYNENLRFTLKTKISDSYSDKNTAHGNHVSGIPKYLAVSVVAAVKAAFFSGEFIGRLGVCIPSRSADRGG